MNQVLHACLSKHSTTEIHPQLDAGILDHYHNYLSWQVLSIKVLPSVGVTNHMLAQQAYLPRLHSLLLSLKHVINKQPGPDPKAGKERRKMAGKDFKVITEPQN